MKFCTYKVKYLHDIFSVVTSAGWPARLVKLEKLDIFKKVTGEAGKSMPFL